MHRPGWTFQCNGAVGCGGAISGSESVLGTAARPTGAGDSLSDRGKGMWVWRKAHGEAREPPAGAGSAGEGKPRHDLLREAVRTLLASGRTGLAFGLNPSRAIREISAKLPAFGESWRTRTEMRHPRSGPGCLQRLLYLWNYRSACKRFSRNRRPLPGGPRSDRAAQIRAR